MKVYILVAIEFEFFCKFWNLIVMSIKQYVFYWLMQVIFRHVPILPKYIPHYFCLIPDFLLALFYIDNGSIRKA